MAKFEVSYLHEKTGHERLTNVRIVVLGRELGRNSLQVKLVHNARQLRPHVVGVLQRAVVDEVVVTPLYVFVVCNE